MSGGVEILCADVALKLHEAGVRVSGEVDPHGIALCRVPGVPGLMPLGDVVGQMMLGAIGQFLQRNETAAPTAIGGGLVVGQSEGGADETESPAS